MDAADIAVRAQGLNKRYRLYDRPMDRVKEKLLRKSCHREVWALKDIDVEVAKGSALGIVGSNGAGKSTFLKILSGTSMPSSGTFELNGTVASLLELGTGFYPGFTGYQNIFLNGMVMGLSRQQMEEKAEEIVEFSELGHFIHQPIRTYSSGMIMRLGFSVVTAIDPEVLIIDEILAVGDLHFQKKCFERILSFRASGKTILFCSHSMYHIEEICDRAVWIQDGRVRMNGKATDVTRSYETYERSRRASYGSLVAGEDAEEEKKKEAPKFPIPAEDAEEEETFESETPHILNVRLLRPDGEEARTEDPETGEFPYGGELLDDFIVEIDYEIPHDLPALVLAFAIYRGDSEMMTGFGSNMSGYEPPTERGHYRAHLRFPKVRFLHGAYRIVTYLAGEKGMHVYHGKSLDGRVLLKQQTSYLGMVYMDHEWSVERLPPSKASTNQAKEAGSRGNAGD